MTPKIQNFSRLNRLPTTFKIELIVSVDNEKLSNFNSDITQYRACTQVVIRNCFNGACRFTCLGQINLCDVSESISQLHKLLKESRYSFLENTKQQ